jgi:hypothetical protein
VNDAERAVLASMRGGRVLVPWATASEVVAQLEAQGCEVVRCAWCAVIVWVA